MEQIALALFSSLLWVCLRVTCTVRLKAQDSRPLPPCILENGLCGQEARPPSVGRNWSQNSLEKTSSL